MTTERCLICGRSLGTTLLSTVKHAMKYHEAVAETMRVSLDGEAPPGWVPIWIAPSQPPTP